MTGRNVALVFLVFGLILAFIGGAYLPVWLRGPLVGAISGGIGVAIVHALAGDQPIRILKRLPMLAGFGALVGLMAAFGSLLSVSGAS